MLDVRKGFDSLKNLYKDKKFFKSHIIYYILSKGNQ